MKQGGKQERELNYLLV